MLGPRNDVPNQMAPMIVILQNDFSHAVNGLHMLLLEQAKALRVPISVDMVPVDGAPMATSDVQVSVNPSIAILRSAQRYSCPHVVVYSQHMTPGNDPATAIRQGATALVEWASDSRRLIEILSLARMGQEFISTCLLHTLFDQLKGRNHRFLSDHRLSDREYAVLRLLTEGETPNRIARRLGVTARTVKFHQSNIYRKLDVRSAHEAIAVAFREGFIV